MTPHELFPNANVEKGLTFSGLLDGKYTFSRRDWGRILSLTDDELAEGLHRKGVVSNMPKSFTPEVHYALCKHLVRVGAFEKALSGLLPKEVGSFFDGYLAGKE